MCRIEGSVHATVKDESLAAASLLLAQPVGLEGEREGEPLIAVDRAGAGDGDLVLVMKEGGSARIVLENEDIPVQCVIVAVIDDVQIWS